MGVRMTEREADDESNSGESARQSRREEEFREAAPDEEPRCRICGVPEGAPHIQSMHDKA